MDEEFRPALSGTVYIRNVQVFREVVGDDAVDRALASLDPDQKSELESVAPETWISVTTIDTLYTRIAEEAGQDLFELYPDVVRAGISQTLRSVWRALLRLTTDRALLRRSPLIYARGHSVGAIEPRILGPGRAVVVLSGWPNMPSLRRLGVASGIRATLEVAGRKNVRVEYTDTDDGAVYRINWQA